jgi:hypothetical protein
MAACSRSWLVAALRSLSVAASRFGEPVLPVVPNLGQRPAQVFIGLFIGRGGGEGSFDCVVRCRNSSGGHT